MNKRSSIDSVNLQTLRSSVNVYKVVPDTWSDEMIPAESFALSTIAAEITNKPILDLGVGGGRTVKALTAISADYRGIDYVEEMVALCKETFPHLQFSWADARDLSLFGSNTFSLVFFSCTGICMVDHDGRIKILNEVLRVLRPGGIFIFSSGNRNRKKHHQFLRLPKCTLSVNPLRMILNVTRFLYNSVTCFLNRIKFKKLEIECAEYSLVNDTYHNYSTMIYYITQEEQMKQLASVGFSSGVEMYTETGKVTSIVNTNDITYLARKP
jgi:SAM-dependent methyltransferase